MSCHYFVLSTSIAQIYKLNQTRITCEIIIDSLCILSTYLLRICFFYFMRLNKLVNDVSLRKGVLIFQLRSQANFYEL